MKLFALPAWVYRAAAVGALLLGACLMLTLSQTTPARSDERIVLLVNDQPISEYDVDQRERFLTITTHKPASAALRKEATDMLIDESLQLQAGKNMKIFPDESEVNRVLQGMASKNHLTVAKLTDALGHLGVNIETLKNRIRAELVWQQVIRKKFGPTVQIGEAAIDKAVADAKPGNLAAATTVAVMKVRFLLPSHANSAVIATRLADADTFQNRFRSCSSVGILARDFKRTTVSKLTIKASQIPQPARVMVMKASLDSMTAPSITRSSVDLYAVCGKAVAQDAPIQRDTAERALMGKDLSMKAKRLLRDLRQDAYIEHRD